MNLALPLLAVAAVVALYAACIKLAARLLRAPPVSWLGCFACALTVLAAGVVAGFMPRLEVLPWLGFVIGIVAAVIGSGWVLGRFGAVTAGAVLGSARGAGVTAIGTGLFATLAVLLLYALHRIHPLAY